MSRTIKVVMIGSSGTGKTSLRGQYISGQFSTGYRATIGTDFVAKTVYLKENDDPADADSTERPRIKVNVQIWDTAGQERFSALSSAFYRGADATILVYDIGNPKTLQDLEAWWANFVDKCPVDPGEEIDWPIAVVGNKLDLLEGEAGGVRDREDAVWRTEEAQAFVRRLVGGDEDTEDLNQGNVPLASSSTPSSAIPDSGSFPGASIPITVVSPSEIGSANDSTFMTWHTAEPGLIGTMKSTATGNTIYHTPSSSFFEPPDTSETPSDSQDQPVARSGIRSPPPGPAGRRATLTSVSSSISTPTITPSLFRRQALTGNANPSSAPRFTLPPLERGAKLFFASAKTGEGVPDVFDYIARRTIARLEWLEAEEAMFPPNDHSSPITRDHPHHSRTTPLQALGKLSSPSDGTRGRCCS